MKTTQFNSLKTTEFDSLKTTQFYSLKGIRGNEADFHRNRKTGRYRNRKEGKFCEGGVYFWGFTLREDGNLPKSKDELVIYYIGKSEENIVERIMQEVTQLIFGGFGTIIDHNWLIKNPCKARIFDKQKPNMNGPLDPDVLYKSYGLHVLYDFLYGFFDNGNTKIQPRLIQPTLNWMKERLIFAWIEDETWIDVENNVTVELNKVENEFHHIVRTNVFGIGRIKNLTPKKDVNNPKETPFFNSIDWRNNRELRDWLIAVNNNIP